MIEIKKKNVLHFEFIDEGPKDFPKDFPKDLTFENIERIDMINFKGKNRYIREVDGYHISLNKLGGFFGDSEERFQKKLFISHSIIKMVREEYEYNVDKQDVSDLIEKNCSEGISEDDIEKTLVGKDVKLSKEGLITFFNSLKRENKILRNKNKPDSWITKRFSNDRMDMVCD